jgi:hypothetical protein
MKLEDFREMKMHIYKHNPASKEIEVGDPVASAFISSTSDAWVEGYAKGSDGKYHHSFQGGISQHEDPQYPGSKNEPKYFQIFIVGIVDEGKTHNLAYATSLNNQTRKIHTLRITNLDHFTGIEKIELIHKKA